MYQHIEEFQAAMSGAGIALSVLRLPENMTLFTQYWPRNANSYLVIPETGKPAVVVPLVETEDAELAELTNVYSYNDVDMASGDPDEQTVAVFRKLAEAYGLEKDAKIGLELDYDMVAPCFCSGKVSLVGRNTYRLVTEGFGSNHFVTVRDLIPPIMAIKNEQDIEKLKVVNELAAQAMDRFEDLIQVPHTTELAVVTEIEKQLQLNAAGFCGARVARAWAQLSTGKKGEVASCEGVISDRRVLQDGDCCLLELGLCVDGYWADITRSAVVGGARGESREMLDLIHQAFEAGVAAARPGATGSDIDRATRKVMEDAGYGKYYLHPAGHGTGFNYHESIPTLSPSSQDVLKENMVIAIEPGLYVPGVGGLRKELNVLVTPHGGVPFGW